MTPPGDLGRGSGLQLSPTKDLKSVNWGSEVICTAYRPRRMGLTRSGLLKVASLLDLLQARYTGGSCSTDIQLRFSTVREGPQPTRSSSANITQIPWLMVQPTA